MLRKFIGDRELSQDFVMLPSPTYNGYSRLNLAGGPKVPLDKGWYKMHIICQSRQMLGIKAHVLGFN